MINEFLVKMALAQEGLVPCEGVNCTEQDFYDLIVNVIEFAIQYLAFPLVVLFFLWGGFLFVTSGGSTTRIEQGKKAITGAVIGLVIVLSSVVIIHTFFKFFVDETVCKSTLDPFWTVECKKENVIEKVAE